jgi:hypothetical protein
LEFLVLFSDQIIIVGTKPSIPTFSICIFISKILLFGVTRSKHTDVSPSFWTLSVSLAYPYTYRKTNENHINYNVTHTNTTTTTTTITVRAHVEKTTPAIYQTLHTVDLHLSDYFMDSDMFIVERGLEVTMVEKPPSRQPNPGTGNGVYNKFMLSFGT